MAKIVEDILVIKFSKIIKDNDVGDSNLISDDTLFALVQVAEELTEKGIIVEVERP
jgi:hypothetical protein